MFINNKYTTAYYKIINNALFRKLDGYVERHHIIPKCLGGTNDISNIVILSAREHFICHRLLIRMVEENYKHKLVFAAWQQSRSAKYHNVTITSRTYDFLRTQLSETYKGKKRAPFSDKTKDNMKAAAKTRKPVIYTEDRLEKLRQLGHQSKGKKLSDESKRKISNANAGKALSDEHKQKIADSKTGVKRAPFSDSHRHKMSISHSGIIQSDETKYKKSQSMKGKNVGKPGPNKGLARTDEVKLKISLTKKLLPTVCCPHCGKEGKGGNMIRYHFNNCKSFNNSIRF